MGRARTWAVVSLLVACSPACAAITGLSDLQEVQDLGEDGGADGTSGDAPPGRDAPPPRDAPADAIDAAVDAPLQQMDSGLDGDIDTGIDAAVDAGIDAPLPVDCGVPNTVENCSACGLACDMGVSLDAGCNGATCTYAGCLSGHANCNTAAPDTNGCECPTPSCCANACQDTHHNGVGQFFYDCVSPGTITQPQAKEACTAFTSNGALCNVAACDDAGTTAMCTTPTKNTCICWAFAGSGGGHVAPGLPAVVDGGNELCQCPTAASASWN